MTALQISILMTADETADATVAKKRLLCKILDVRMKKTALSKCTDDVSVSISTLLTISCLSNQQDLFT